ncbi:MAG: hypothetical protein KF887_12055 [Paracoccaceae bacterium]|nr:MAG: hypothetical protein KF887_12055 [Paracoccaceae bacterium]
MSAIDWLSESVTRPQSTPEPEAPVASNGAAPSDVAVSVLDAPSADAAGTLPTSVTGLPRRLWGLGRTEDILRLIAVDRADVLPALRSLLVTVLLAETEPPADATGAGRLLLMRVDKLLDMGAIEEAGALVAAAGRIGGAPEADLFRRDFDVAMLTGTEDRACAAMRVAPRLAPTFPARIFCLARAGDWNAAALTLRTAQALGHIGPAEDALLSRFLDPDLYEEEPLPEIPRPVTPLTWRLLEAIGEGMPTTALPLAFAHAELRETAGWKAQIEAAERLARAGVLDPNALLGIYTARLPAASGGVWDRVEAFQRFDTALAAGDPGAVAASLPRAWDRMVEAELEVPFASLFAARLMRLPLTGESGALAFRIALLSPQYERAALARSPADGTEAFLIGLARGDLSGVTPPDSLARAIAPAFLRQETGAELAALVAEDRQGEAILMAVDRVRRGVQGDLRGVTEGLSLLRAVGLENAARRTALELMLLERRG